jgi:hypothetical protein
MTTTTFILILLAALVIVYVALAVRTYVRMRGTRVVICPETHEPAAVTVDAGHAAVSALWDKPDLQLKTCSRWPEKHDCNQACTGQIAVSPEDTLAANILKRWFDGRDCAICKRPIGVIHTTEPRPGLLNVTTGRREILGWNDIPADHLPQAFESHLPVCANCVIAETFRLEFPDRVTDRRETAERDTAYH